MFHFRNLNFLKITTKMLLLFILFQLKETILATSTPSPTSTELNPYEITQSINTSVVETLLKNVCPDEIVNLINEIKYHRSTYEIENTPLLEHFRDKIFFNNIEVRGIFSEPDGKVNQPIHSAISYNIAKNEIIIFVDTIYFKIYGYIGTEPGTDDVSGFRAILGYKSFTLNATKQGEHFSINVNGVMIKDEVQLLPRHNNAEPNSPYAALEGQIKDNQSHSTSHTLPDYELELLSLTIKPSIPSILVDNIKLNKNFSHFLNTNFGCSLQPKQKLFSRNVGLKVETKRPFYYYLIPTVSMVRFNVSDIKIRGLWNYQYVAYRCIVETNKYHSKSATMVHTGGIAGSMNWYHGVGDEPNLELDFNASKIFARVNHGTGIVNLILDNYRVIRTTPDLLSSSEVAKLSKYMKLFLESTIASAILPAMTNQTSEILIRESQELYNETVNWFEQKYSYTDSPQQSVTDQDLNHSCLNSSNENTTFLTIYENADKPYHISFPNTSIKIIAKYSNLVGLIQKEFVKNLKFTREVDAVLVGTVHLNENKSDTLALNFHCNFTKLKFTMTKDQLGPKEKCTYEFEIFANQDIELELLHAKNTTNETITDDQLNAMKEADLPVLTTIKQRIIRNLKSIVYFPLDVDESVKMIDHYLLRYTDNLLKKCSLRRDTTTIR